MRVGGGGISADIFARAARDRVRPRNRLKAPLQRVEQLGRAAGTVRHSYHSSVAGTRLAQLAIQPFDLLGVTGEAKAQMEWGPSRGEEQSNG
jgi:hypothetical protein